MLEELAKYLGDALKTLGANGYDPLVFVLEAWFLSSFLGASDEFTLPHGDEIGNDLLGYFGRKPVFSLPWKIANGR
jgi:hypothetical protein